jgi:hypothetical protein
MAQLINPNPVIYQPSMARRCNESVVPDIDDKIDAIDVYGTSFFKKIILDSYTLIPLAQGQKGERKSRITQD